MKLVRRFITVLIIFLCSSFILLIIFLNYKLYATTSFVNTEGVAVNNGLIKQLNYLQKEMQNGAAEKMQQYYPEGFVFTEAVYGLSWAAVADVIPHNTSLYIKASNEMNWCYKSINSEKGKNRFDKTLPIPYGAYYTGWCNYLLGRKLKTEDIGARHPVEIRDFKNACQQIDSNIRRAIYPESYPGYSWPADVFVAVACLALHDEIFEPEYQQVVVEWLTKVKSHPDKNGFIPYAAAPDGTLKENARGSSESLILNFLYDIDTGFANIQFKLYQQQFLDYRFGLPGIREFPKGNTNTGDVDSGPVVLGMGSAATIVGLKVLTQYHDSLHAIPLRNSLETFGIAFESETEKKYLFGAWPMADVFLAWAHTNETQQTNALNAPSNWRITFQLYSITLLILFAGSIYLLLKRNKRIVTHRI